MSPEKSSILELLSMNTQMSALDIAKNFCKADRYGYQLWYDRIASLERQGLVRIKNDDAFPYGSVELTPKGEDALAQARCLIHRRRIENIRYIITTAIAVVAIILAAISLLAQLGLVQLPQAGLPK